TDPSPLKSHRPSYGAPIMWVANVSRSEPFATWLSSKSADHASGPSSSLRTLFAAQCAAASVPMPASEASAFGAPCATESGKPSQSPSSVGMVQKLAKVGQGSQASPGGSESECS